MGTHLNRHCCVVSTFPSPYPLCLTLRAKIVAIPLEQKFEANQFLAHRRSDCWWYSWGWIRRLRILQGWEWIECELACSRMHLHSIEQTNDSHALYIGLVGLTAQCKQSVYNLGVRRTGCYQRRDCTHTQGPCIPAHMMIGSTKNLNCLFTFPHV